MSRNSANEQRAAVRRVLMRWGAATQLCRRKQEEIAEYRGLIDATYGLHAQQYTGMPRSGTVSNPTAMTAEHAEKLREAYKRRIADIAEDIAELMDFCAAIDSILLDLPPDQQRMLVVRGGGGVSVGKPPWVRVGVLAGVSEDWARELERKAIDILCNAMDFKKIS